MRVRTASERAEDRTLTCAVTCFGYEGIDAVKEALRTAEAKNTPDNQVKVKLVSPPLYGTSCNQLFVQIGANNCSPYVAVS